VCCSNALRRFSTDEPNADFTLVLLRHGESLWNSENRFTGWCDVDLTERGRQDAEDAGALLAKRGLRFDVAFTSTLKRAWETCDIVLKHAAEPHTKVIKTGHLNERHYGALQGLSKRDPALIARYGKDQIMEWRRSYQSRPPPSEPGHPFWQPPPAPATESLQDCEGRVKAYYEKEIAPRISSGERVLIVAHANSIRALVKMVDEISAGDIRGVRIPNSIPLVYHLDKELLPTAKEDAWGFQGAYVTSFETIDKLIAVERSKLVALNAVFASIDVDGDGFIQSDELQRWLEDSVQKYELTGSASAEAKIRFILKLRSLPLYENHDISYEDFLNLSDEFWESRDHFLRF